MAQNLRADSVAKTPAILSARGRPAAFALQHVKVCARARPNSYSTSPGRTDSAADSNKEVWTHPPPATHVAPRAERSGPSNPPSVKRAVRFLPPT